MPDNYGAKDHLRQTFAAMKRRVVKIIIITDVPSGSISNSTEGSDEMDS